MSIKLIALGNRLMGDDAAGIVIAEKLKELLEKYDIEVIIGETDTEYCFYKINEEDFLIIIDSTYYGKKPGSISLIPLNIIINSRRNLCSQHQRSLFDLLLMHKKQVNGLLIGIEAKEIYFSDTLSHELQNSIEDICSNIYAIVLNIIRAY